MIVVWFVGTSFVTLWSLVLPKVEHSLYFHRNKELTINNKRHQSNEVTIDDNASVSHLELSSCTYKIMYKSHPDLYDS